MNTPQFGDAMKAAPRRQQRWPRTGSRSHAITSSTFVKNPILMAIQGVDRHRRRCLTRRQRAGGDAFDDVQLMRSDASLPRAGRAFVFAGQLCYCRVRQQILV